MHTVPYYGNRIKVGFGIDQLKVYLCIIIISKYHNSQPQLFECEEHNLDSCSRENILWFNISWC